MLYAVAHAVTYFDLELCASSPAFCSFASGAQETIKWRSSMPNNKTRESVTRSGEASPTFGHANANFSLFIDRIRNQFLKK